MHSSVWFKSPENGGIQAKEDVHQEQKTAIITQLEFQASGCHVSFPSKLHISSQSQSLIPRH